jgi:ubiquitin C-terminal hydrolase
MQQDAHEFFNYLLNAISETLSEERKKDYQNGPHKMNTTSKKGGANASNAQHGDATKSRLF